MMQAGTCTYLGRAVLPHDASPNMSGDRSSMSPPSSWQPATCSNLFVADFSMTSLNQVRACRSGTYLYENLDIKRSADRVDQSVPSFLRSCVRLSALRLCDPSAFWKFPSGSSCVCTLSLTDCESLPNLFRI